MLFKSINFTFTVVVFHLKMEQQQQNMITVFHLRKCSVNFAVYKMRKAILVSLRTNQYFSRRLKPINCIVWGTENILLYSLFISSDGDRSYEHYLSDSISGNLGGNSFSGFFPKLDCPFLNNMPLKEVSFIFLFIEVSCGSPEQLWGA